MQDVVVEPEDGPRQRYVASVSTIQSNIKNKKKSKSESLFYTIIFIFMDSLHSIPLFKNHICIIYISISKAYLSSFDIVA